MYLCTLIHLLLCKVDLILLSILLDYHQRIYICHLLRLPEILLTKEILPISLKKGDQDFQLEKLLEN